MQRIQTQVLTSRNTGHQPRGIHKGGGSHAWRTRHLSGLRQGVCGTDSAKPRLPIASNPPFETKHSLVQQVGAIHSTDSGLGLGPGSERRHFSQNNCVWGVGVWGGGEPTAAAEWLPLAISQICAESGEGRWAMEVGN